MKWFSMVVHVTTDDQGVVKNGQEYSCIEKSTYHPLFDRKLPTEFIYAIIVALFFAFDDHSWLLITRKWSKMVKHKVLKQKQLFTFK